MAFAKFIAFSFFVFFIFPLQNAYPEIRISQIHINNKNVFDSTKREWFFAAPLANSIHVTTKKYLIEDELLFAEDDFLDWYDLEENERNLRATGLFTYVSIIADSVNDILSDVIITTQDKWTTNPSILFGTGGNANNIGLRLEELNLAGTGTKIFVEGFYRTENKTGWQGAAGLFQRRLFRSEYALDANILSNKYRTEQNLSFYKPYRTQRTIYSYGISGENSFGSDFRFSADTFEMMPFHNRKINAWFSRAWLKDDRVFATAFLELDDVERGKKEYERAFDNSGKILIAFSSIAEDYIKTTKLNHFQTEDVPIGGWGTAILGKTFAIGSKGESLYYVAAQGEKSYVTGNFYLFGQLSGASGFKGSEGKYTYEEFYGTAFYRLSNIFLLAGRIRQQSVWNWNKGRQLILDNNSGLRGYSVNKLQGDNRFVANFEVRSFPDFHLWIFNIGAVAFYDVGSAWRQKTAITEARWHNSAGIGFRIQNMKDTGANSLFRIDFAYNFDERKMGEIIFTSDQLFSVFGKHIFKLPQIFGQEFDYE